MSYEPRSLTDAIAAAVGDSPRLIAELHSAFAESIARQIEALEHAQTSAEWIEAAHRLRGLAASFGADAVMGAAADALHGRPGDARAIARIRQACAFPEL